MSLLARVPPRGHEPRDTSALPDDCPRCGASLERGLREVNLLLTLDDGAEVPVVGYECNGCGWCVAPEP